MFSYHGRGVSLQNDNNQVFFCFKTLHFKLIGFLLNSCDKRLCAAKKGLRKSLWVISSQLHKIFQCLLKRKRLCWYIHLISLNTNYSNVSIKGDLAIDPSVGVLSISFGHLFATPSKQCSSMGGGLLDSYSSWIINVNSRLTLEWVALLLFPL